MPSAAPRASDEDGKVEEEVRQDLGQTLAEVNQEFGLDPVKAPEFIEIAVDEDKISASRVHWPAGA